MQHGRRVRMQINWRQRWMLIFVPIARLIGSSPEHL